MSKNEPQMFVTEHWSSRILSYGIFTLILYAMYGVVYRLYLSPLANFPGPKIAALTDWYEFYYDVIKRGKYTWRIAEMHERYGMQTGLIVRAFWYITRRWLIEMSRVGPIIRISPDQLHINDPDFLDEIYPGSAKKTDKPPRYAGMFGRGEATFSTPSHELHRTRRAWISPFFSKRSITRLEPVLQSAVDKLCGRLGGFWESGEPVNLRSAYMALTMDVINQYCFARSDNNLDAPDFNPSWWVFFCSVDRGTERRRLMWYRYQAMMELSELSHSKKIVPIPTITFMFSFR